MRVEIDEVPFNDMIKCNDCGTDNFEGEYLYYIKIESISNEIVLCRECADRLRVGLDEILSFDV